MYVLRSCSTHTIAQASHTIYNVLHSSSYACQNVAATATCKWHTPLLLLSISQETIKCTPTATKIELLTNAEEKPQKKGYPRHTIPAHDFRARVISTQGQREKKHGVIYLSEHLEIVRFAQFVRSQPRWAYKVGLARYVLMVLRLVCMCLGTTMKDRCRSQGSKFRVKVAS